MPTASGHGQPIPIFVMLPLGTISMENQVAEPERLRSDLEALNRVGVDGVMVDCWWGIVERRTPQLYDWNAYRELFSIVRDCQLELHVVMSFHKCGDNPGDDVYIPLPQWVLTVGERNPDIFFTSRARTRNLECLTFGIDREPVLENRTALEVYRDYMQSFRTNLQEFLDDGTITGIEVGMGPGGELRYPSYPEPQGWRYPGTGEFQCWDTYLLQSFRNEARRRGHPTWTAGPSDAGDYNSTPQDSAFFRGGYTTAYGEFFLDWYSQTLIQHGDSVLTVAEAAFGSTILAAKIAGIHWWYRTQSHAAELAAGYYNLGVGSRDGYTPIASMLARHNATFIFTCIEKRTAQENTSHPEALADPEALVSQVLEAAWDNGVEVAGENALCFHDRSGYDQILAQAGNRGPANQTLAGFTYLRLGPELMQGQNWSEFMRFVNELHRIRNSLVGHIFGFWCHVGRLTLPVMGDNMLGRRCIPSCKDKTFYPSVRRFCQRGELCKMTCTVARWRPHVRRIQVTEGQPWKKFAKGNCSIQNRAITAPICRGQPLLQKLGQLWL